MTTPFFLVEVVRHELGANGKVIAHMCVVGLDEPNLQFVLRDDVRELLAVGQRVRCSMTLEPKGGGERERLRLVR